MAYLTYLAYLAAVDDVGGAGDVDNHEEKYLKHLGKRVVSEPFG